jgi:hypothetical protein
VFLKLSRIAYIKPQGEHAKPRCFSRTETIKIAIWLKPSRYTVIFFIIGSLNLIQSAFAVFRRPQSPNISFAGIFAAAFPKFVLFCSSPPPSEGKALNHRLHNINQNGIRKEHVVCTLGGGVYAAKMGMMCVVQGPTHFYHGWSFPCIRPVRYVKRTEYEISRLLESKQLSFHNEVH